MDFLLNISTHGSDIDIAGPGWKWAESFLEETGFSGYEVYPVSGYPFEEIPAALVRGVHLRFFVILEPIWNGDRKRLLEIFGDDETIRHYYGGTGREAVVETYRNQLELARKLGAEYAVFHAAHCELEYIYNWDFPWDWRAVIDLSAEIMNEVMKDCGFTGTILYENLWWPGSLTLDSPREIHRLLDATEHPDCGIVLDTGHILNKNPRISSEKEGIKYLIDNIRNLGESASRIKAVHLSRSLSADYVSSSRNITDPYRGAGDFWERLAIAREHVHHIDAHEPFEHPEICRLFDYIDPANVVFEFTFRDRAQWRSKVAAQKAAMNELLLKA